jgi:hypothetical protein
VGIGAGLLALTGIYVIIGFFIALFMISYLYYSKMLNINEEDFGANELFMEGVGNAFGLFMVSSYIIFKLKCLAIMDLNIHIRLIMQNKRR